MSPGLGRIATAIHGHAIWGQSPFSGDERKEYVIASSQIGVLTIPSRGG